MKRKIGLWVLLVVLCLLFAGPALAAKSYSAERFDVLLDIQADGSLLVTETIRFRFVGGPFTYVFRDLSYSGLDEIDRLQASMDGVALRQGAGPGQVEVVVARPLKVTWHFAPTSDAAHEFALTYRVRGAIRKEANADALIWRAIPEEHGYEIDRSTITLRYPASTPLLGAPQLSRAGAGQESGAGQVTWTVERIGNDESLVVTARFAPGSLAQAAPRWQVREAQRQQQISRAVRAGLPALLLTLALGGAALAAVLLQGRRDALAERAPSWAVARPPDQAPPALGVRLAGGSAPVLATLYDLAERGLLRVQESGKSFLGARQYALHRLPSDAPLRPHEEGLLRALFHDRSGRERDTLPLSGIANRLASHGKWYRKPLEEEMEKAGWIDPQRKARRNGLMIAALAAILLGVLVMLGGFVLAGLSLPRDGAPALSLGGAAVGVGLALFPLGFAAAIAGASFSPLSERGEQAAASWKAFAAYLKQVVRGRESVSGAALFESYLPFAAGLGMGERWAKVFRKQGYVAIPTWFQGLDPESDEFDSLVAVIASIHASASSGSGGASGASGASGGGASGAG